MQFPDIDIGLSDEEILADRCYPAPAPTPYRPQEPAAPDEWARRITVRWADVDANGHMHNTAYSDLASDARLAFFAEHGFPLGKLRQLRLAPVILAERLSYRREAMLGEELSVSVAVAGLNEDASRGTMEHRIRKADGAVAALVRIDGAWLSLETRKIVAPPRDLAQVMRSAPRSGPAPPE
jgi:acyl-CoA thioester hydrolase